jgi:yecA family protein
VEQKVEHDFLQNVLQRSGSSWDAAQTHGLLTGRLATLGVRAGPDWLLHVLEGTDAGAASNRECRELLDDLYQSTFWQLSERLSEFQPLLPSTNTAIELRVAALAHWCEGFLHGLVSTAHAGALQERLATEPLADMIKDMLQLTRAGPDHDGDSEENDGAYADLVEYLRVAAQLSYEELADLHDSAGGTA